MQRPNLSSTAAFIAWHARRTPDAPAILEPGSQTTYRGLGADLIRCVRALGGHGVKSGMLLAVAVPEFYLHLLLLLAAEVIGATTTPLTYGDLSTDDPLVARCDVILTRSAPLAAGAPRIVAIPSDWPATLAAGSVDDEDLSPLERRVAPDAVTRIIRTSGTTGRPKAMPLLNAAQQLRITRMIDRVARDVLPNPRFLCLYPISVNGVCMRVFGTLQHGGAVIFGSGSDACALIAGGAVNYAHIAVGDCERIARATRRPPAGHALHLELFGAAVSAPLRQLVRDRLSDRLTINYSSNEISSIAAMDDENVGTLCPGVEVRIVDGNGLDKPAGEAGRIAVKGDTMVRGYFNDPALTASAFVDGWFQSGDIGSLPAPGRLLVLGRDDDMLNIGGVKVARLPLEARIKLSCGVEDAAVLCVANRNGVGMLVVAIETTRDRLPVGLMEQVGSILSKYVGTFEVMPLRWFPRSPSGKVRRPEIEAAFRQRQARLGAA